MPFANTQMMGLNMAFPDVCLTPPFAVPVPYPNLTMPMMAIPSQFKTYTLAMPNHNLMTIIPLSMGDNTGVMLNPVSGMVMGPTRALLGSFKTLIGGAPASKMLGMTGQNGISPGSIGFTLVPSQTKLMILS